MFHSMIAKIYGNTKKVAIHVGVFIVCFTGSDIQTGLISEERARVRDVVPLQ